MANQSITSNSFFPDYSAGFFRNSIQSLNITVWNRYADLLFSGDLDRIVYAPSDFAFRKRAKTQPNNSLNLPFINFKIARGGINLNTDRDWKNHALATQGMWIKEIDRKVRLYPVTIAYDAKLYIHLESDAHWAFSELVWEDALETKLEPSVAFIDQNEEEQIYKNIGVLSMSLNFESEYNENDWLKENKIRVIEINPSFQTFFIKENFSRFCVPKEFILDFADRKGDIDDEDRSYDEIYKAVIDQVSEETNDLELS